ncbi:hypothetical protein [Paenirhodobacter populi]|uniref:Uncharacterized protein n=1 Tax=Paenirhodobacter populi TaxID=2306993 RepID=A0A443JVR6_9RHOB|nr:hypothetical protein [Sinirhodobacter populi]RWR24603.1 hypothetical protein D2T30_01495 [Sinirhodobacter populi]
MQVAFHVGAFDTESDIPIRILRANDDILEEEGVIIASPEEYGNALREPLVALRGGVASAGMRDQVVMACTGRPPGDVDRLVITQRGLLAGPDRAVTAEGLYPLAPQRIGALANLFPQDEVEFHFSIISPVLLLQSLSRKRDYAELLDGRPPEQLLWSPVIARMAEAAQGRRLVVWCNEDLPLILPEVVRSLAALDPSTQLRSEDLLLRALLTPEGLRELQDDLAPLPPQAIAARRALTVAALDRHARPGRMDQEISIPGWSEDLVHDLTDLYEDDVSRLAAMPGVTFIAP